MAEQGLKALIPIGRPFLDYLLSNLVRAGVEHVCLVVRPQHDDFKRYYESGILGRLRMSFAVQRTPLGTAHALQSAENFAGTSPFLLLNSDNYYPLSALHDLCAVRGDALAGFEKGAMLRGNVSPQKLGAMAPIAMNRDGTLQQIIEKPPPEVLEAWPEPLLLSMNCWRFGPRIFEACRSIPLSVRNEYELPAAVMYSIEHLGCRFRVIPCPEPVLDLSSRQDVTAVEDKLAGVEVQL